MFAIIVNFTWAWQSLWLIPPPVGRIVAIVGQLPGGSRGEKLLELALHGVSDWVKVRLMKSKVSSAVGNHLAIIPKRGDRQVCLIPYAHFARHNL
jgi:hypothetical protein